jgi:hypothetical protein
MGDTSLINLGELSKPATVLIEKVSSAVGVLYEPTRIRKEAAAKADAALIEAQSNIVIGDMERRALVRFVVEQTREQKNIENITTKALPQVASESDPAKMDEDWIADFFSKCKKISNSEMQDLWARMLAGEANTPGSVSKRTVDFVASMDRADAELFSRICGLSDTSLLELLIFDTNDPLLTQENMSWADLAHLDNIGLIQLENLTGFARQGVPETFLISVAGEALQITVKAQKGKMQLNIGRALFTKTGKELRRFVHIIPPKGFYDYCVKHWSNGDCVLASPYPKIQIC